MTPAELRGLLADMGVPLPLTAEAAEADEDFDGEWRLRDANDIVVTAWLTEDEARLIAAAVNELGGLLDRLEAQEAARQLSERLSDFADHRPFCASLQRGACTAKTGPCDCGLDAARKETRTAREIALDEAARVICDVTAGNGWRRRAIEAIRALGKRELEAGAAKPAPTSCPDGAVHAFFLDEDRHEERCMRCGLQVKPAPTVAAGPERDDADGGGR